MYNPSSGCRWVKVEWTDAEGDEIDIEKLRGRTSDTLWVRWTDVVLDDEWMNWGEVFTAVATEYCEQQGLMGKDKVLYVAAVDEDDECGPLFEQS